MLREHVYDRTGARYLLHCDATKDGGMIRLSKMNARVGHAIYVIEAGWVRLVDLKIFGPNAGAGEPEPVIAGLRTVASEGYHGRGLGTVLLQCVSESASAAGCMGVVGYIAPRHLNLTPFLLSWFGGNGYTVTEMKDSAEWTAKVSLRLGQVDLSSGG